MITEKDLDARLAHADRSLTVEEAALDALSIATREVARARRSRTRVVIAGGLVLGLAAAGAAAPAAAGVVRAFLAQADWFPRAGGEVLPDSEWVDTSAPDLRDYLENTYPDDLPLAPGQNRASLIDQVAEIHQTNPGLTQQVSLRRSFERLVHEAWIAEWIDADAVGDARRAEIAADVLAEAPDWPAFVATDGGGITDRMRDLAAAAADGDSATVRRLGAGG